MIKVVLVGHGYLGKWHAQKIWARKDLWELVCIVESDTSKHKELESLYPNVKIESQFNNLKVKCDAAFIVSPTSEHFNIIMSCLEKGLHVFCEKPLVETSLQCMQIEKHPNFSKLTIQPGHIERYQSAWNEIEKKGFNEILKKANFFRAIRAAPFKGRALDVHVTNDLMIHDIDLLLMYWKAKPVSVQATGASLFSKKLDHVTANFKFEDGKVASIVASRCALAEERWVEFLGQDGVIKIDFAKLFITLNKNLLAPENLDLPFQKVDQLALEHIEFHEVLKKSKSPIVTYQDARAAIRIIELVHKSIETGKEINIAEDLQC